jgi:hypothetical protein
MASAEMPTTLYAEWLRPSVPAATQQVVDLALVHLVPALRATPRKYVQFFWHGRVSEI